MSTQENKTTARRYFEDIWNKRNLAAIDELVAVNFVGYAPDATIQGAEALKQRINTGLAGYSAMHFTIEDVMAEGDKVCVRWKYHATHAGESIDDNAAGKQATAIGMHLFRIASSKIEEFWVNVNDLE